jgi:glycosyltransferase involved in cell wall biosynthesis
VRAERAVCNMSGIASLNILFVIHTPKNPDTAVFNCCRQLTRYLDDRGHHATIVAPQDFPVLARRHARWFPLLYPIWIAAWMARSANRYQLVVFHSYSGWIVQWLRRIVPAYRHIALVTSFHGLEPIYYNRLCEESLRNKQPLRFRYRFLHGTVVPYLIRVGCRRSDRIVCLNSQEASYLQRHEWGREDRICISSNGVRRRFFVERDYRRAARRLLFVGQWREMKGVHYLVDAFVRLAEQSPDVELRCVGTLEGEATVRACFPAHLQGRISVLPTVRHEEIHDEYRDSDIFLFPTLSEGFSNALLEAMASGLPIVTTSVGAAPDLLESQVSGMLVPIRDVDALVDSARLLMADPGLRERLGRAAQAVADRYEQSAVHERFTTFLEEAASASNGLARGA